MTDPLELVPDTQGDDGQLRQGGRSLLLALYTALRSLKLYPLENATVQKALADLDSTSRTLLQTEIELEIRLAGGFIFVNSTRLRLELDNSASFSHVLAIFRGFEIGALRVRSGADRREWQIFLSLLLSLTSIGTPDERHKELLERAGGAQRGNTRAQPRGA